MQNKKKGTGLNWVLNDDRFLTEKELRHLMNTVKKEKDIAFALNRKTPVKDWFLICIGAETGLRVQEIADLSCGDLHVSSGRASILVKRGKGGKPRVVLVRKQFCQSIRKYLKWKQDQRECIDLDAPLFSTNGKRITKRALQKSYGRSLAKAGIYQPKGVGIHSLRHTYASFLLRASKFNLCFVQRQLGHASVKTTEIYTHLFDSDMQNALARLYG